MVARQRMHGIAEVEAARKSYVHALSLMADGGAPAACVQWSSMAQRQVQWPWVAGW